MSRLSAALALVAAIGLGAAGPLASPAGASEGAGAVSWRLEQPLPPELPDGERSSTPIGLGKIGDVEFWAPNRGLLITAGNPPTIPPGVWAYNGVSWHELADVCGATDGRIAWAGPEEFWTISDGRPGQVVGEGSPPLADNTLCHFSGGQVVGSYASLAFLPTSYQVMHGAACLGPEDCWFGGEPLPDDQTGAFHLHWDGNSLSAVPGPQGHAVEDMRAYDGQIYESVHLALTDKLSEQEPFGEYSDVHLIEPNGVEPSFASLYPGCPSSCVPVYSEEELPDALDFLRLSAGQHALWGAADPTKNPPESTLGQVTVLRDVLREKEETWSQLIGPTTDPEGSNPFTKVEGKESPENEVIESIAAEPPSASEGAEGSESAWLALSSRKNAGQEPLAPAMVARLSGEGDVSERQTLPSEQEMREGIGPKGSASIVTCPAADDCWLATSQGWLFHLAPEDERDLPPDTDPAFAGLITYRPPDAGIPAVIPDALPEDDSGVLGEIPALPNTAVETKTSVEARADVPLLSALHARLVHGTTLELRFHLAVKARVRLLAERHKHLVASTPTRTLAAGERHLLLALNRDRWPTKLTLKTQALAPLPTVSLHSQSVDTISTSMFVQPRLPSFSGLGSPG